MRTKIIAAPAQGETRIVEKFLLFPKTLGAERRWLEAARINQEYRNHHYYLEGHRISFRGWYDVDWAE